MNAPSGLVELGATKVPNRISGINVPMRFRVMDKSQGTGVYDTGFSKTSPCYAGENEGTIAGQVSALRKYIVNPYEKLQGKPGLLDAGNFEFWDSYSVDLHRNRVFNTNKPSDLLGLYVALISRELPSTANQKNPKYRSASYMLEDEAKVKEVKVTRNSNKFQAIANFVGLLNTNKSKAVDLLLYCGIPHITNSTDDATIHNVFMEYMSRFQNVEVFDRAFKVVSDTFTEEVPTIYAKLRKAYLKKAIQKQGNKFILTSTGEEMGTDLKQIALSLIKNPSQEDLLQKVFDLNV